MAPVILFYNSNIQTYEYEFTSYENKIKQVGVAIESFECQLQCWN